MGLWRRFRRRLADATEHRAADGGLRVYDLLLLDAERDALAKRVAQLEAENRDLRRQLDDAAAWPARTTVRLSADERRELAMLRRQVADLHDRLHAMTITSMERDFTGVSP